MSHHKAGAHLKEILLGECTWERRVCPNITCISEQQAWSQWLASWAQMHDIIDTAVGLQREEMNLFFKLQIQAVRKHFVLTSH